MAAIYARVSSEQQKEAHTIESQISELQDEATRRGWQVPDEWIFRDEGYSGASLDRPGLETIRDLIYEGQLSCVLVYAPDRLARKYALQALLLEEFARGGAEVEFIRAVRGETPEEQLLLQFQGMIAEYERAQIMERSRRGKRHKAKEGSVSVLSGAPYGYRYVKTTHDSAAYYYVNEDEACVVRQVFESYTCGGCSMAAIVRDLNNREIPTRTGQRIWERTTIWGMLKNPAYMGRACYGKTKTTSRKKRTRRLRMKGGFSPRNSCSASTPREQWIEIPVPPLIDEATYDWAQERLADNVRKSARRTITPSLLQSILVCDNCGYALYRTSTRTSAGKKIYYYRCIGSDNHRFENGRVCNRSPIRQDILDSLVWDHLISLLQDPSLVRTEIDRRRNAYKDGTPAKKRKAALENDITRRQRQMDKLLDAYQEELMPLEMLRERMPPLRKRLEAARKEMTSTATMIAEEHRLIDMATTIEEFLSCLSSNVHGMDVLQQQKIVRLLVKEVLVGEDRIEIKHSIPATQKKSLSDPGSYLLRTRGERSALRHAAARRLSCAIRQDHPSMQVAADQPQYPLVVDPSGQPVHQQAMVYRVEEALQVAGYGKA